MKKIIKVIMFINLIFLSSLLLSSCSEEEKTVNYRILFSSGTCLKYDSNKNYFLDDYFYIVTDYLKSSNKNFEIYSMLPLKKVDKKTGEVLWEKNGSNDLSDYNQEIRCSIHRRLYVGEVEYFFEPQDDKEIYSCINTLDYFTDISKGNDNASILLFTDELTVDNLSIDYEKYGSFATVEYYISFRPVDDDYIKLLKSYEKKNDDDTICDGEIVNVSPETNFYLSNFDSSITFDYIIEDNSIVLVDRKPKKTIGW